MSIQGKISPRIIQSISTLYNDTNRVFLEFVDNSIDSAEEYFDESKNEYTRVIKISFQLSGINHKDGYVTISDNCKGILNIEKIVQNIGNSDKKAQPWTNGQFGYGMCSFIAACNSLKVVSKSKDSSAYEIDVLKDHFQVDHQEDFIFDDPIKNNTFEYESGTRVMLSNFDRSDWKNISIDEIKSEIEKHFELLLNRKNLEIKLISGNEEYICKPFDYSEYEGSIIDETIEKENSVSGEIEKIHLFIKMTKGKDIKKKPVFIIKGRRIMEISQIKAFKSKYKDAIWAHPNVTGYINLNSYLEPDISRNGFAAKYKNNQEVIYNYLISKEEEVLELIQEGNEESRERHYQQLEDILSSALSKLSKLDAMNFRTDYISGNEIKLKDGGVGVGEENTGEFSTVENSNINKNLEIDGEYPSNQVGGDSNLNQEEDNPFDDKEPEGSPRKKSGFNIKISDREPNTDTQTKELIKSSLVGNTIEIYRKHPFFEDRMSYHKGGGLKVSQRLITYLAGEITVHYKDKFYTKNSQPEYNKRMFESLVESIYKFEELLKDAVGKDLSSWNN
jgi:hypothetical protein